MFSLVRLRCLIGGLLACLTTVAAITDACAHGIAGNRLFPGTFAFDDPAVMDELALSLFSRKQPAADGSSVIDNAASWSFQRLLTPTVSFGVDSGFVRRNWGNEQRSGFDATSLTLKALLYKSDPHEILVSSGLSWRIGSSGAR